MKIILYLAMLGISFFDFRYQLIPDVFQIVLIINRIFMLHGEGFLNYILNGLFLAVPLYLLRIFMNRIFHQDCLGGGDIKLLFSLGIYFEPSQSLYGLFLACIAGLFLALFYLQKHKKIFPFGPCICLGFMLMMIRKNVY